jgi:hypothetical protein
MQFDHESFHFKNGSLGNITVNKIYGDLINTIIEFKERYEEDCGAQKFKHKNSAVFLSEVAVASGAIVADLLSRIEGERERLECVRSFNRLLMTMVEEKAGMLEKAGHA